MCFDNVWDVILKRGDVVFNVVEVTFNVCDYTNNAGDVIWSVGMWFLTCVT